MALQGVGPGEHPSAAGASHGRSAQMHSGNMLAQIPCEKRITTRTTIARPPLAYTANAKT